MKNEDLVNIMKKPKDVSMNSSLPSDLQVVIDESVEAENYGSEDEDVNNEAPEV